MDNTYHGHFAYATSADAAAYMSSLRYPGMGGMAPMTGGGAMHVMPSIDTLTSAAASAAMSAAAACEPLPPSSAMNLLPYSSRVGGNKTSPCAIYRYDDAQGGVGEHKSHQMCTTDGRLFVEHIPNHSIVYVPVESSVDQALRDLRKPRGGQAKQHKQGAAKPAYAPALQPPYSQPMHYDQALHYDHPAAGFLHPAADMPAQLPPMYDQPPLPQPPQKQHIEHPAAQLQMQMQMQLPATSTPAPPAARKPKEKSAKPINAFIKYRSYKIAELKKLHPEVSQTDISRLAGECWKNEAEDIKARFREQYIEEKKLYDLKKISNKRARDSSEAPSDTDASVAAGCGNDSAQAESGSITAPLPSDAAGRLGLPHGFDPKRRRRSLTLPPSGTAEPPRAASSSPMLTPKNPKRRCVTVDMRKQLAKAAFLPPHAIDTGLSRAHSMNDAVAAAAAAAAASISQYDVAGVYAPLGFATPVVHPADVTASPYLDDMSPMRLPVGPSFSLPPALTSMTPPHAADSLAPMAAFDPAAIDENAAAVVAAAAAAAFDLYTSENEELVAASISSLVASTHAAATMPEMAAVSGALVATATPQAVAGDVLSTISSDYFGSPQHH
ncbi:hypothetical protein GGI15_004559 [Coemansia interrupta]|uniref:HMG box domain-containing protein n=1 Tax=Coemansia interrupta TaxID=1126814 RepID=A0A9W8LF52_9FUNG|nr:hypothetical protein GGI15_004559 [Coemansia interrupta]